MSIQLRPLPKFQFITDDGRPANGYKVYAYRAGTVGVANFKDTYTDFTGAVANTNPVILDSRGEADIWFNGIYKIRITDEFDVDVYTVDNYGEGQVAGQSGNYNKILNGSFEADSAGGNTPDDWDITSYLPSNPVLIDDADQVHGSNSLRFISTGLGGGFADSSFFEVAGNEQSSVNFFLKSSVVDVRNVVSVLWYTGEQALISSISIYDNSSTNPVDWTQFFSTVTAPSAARFAKIRITGCDSSDATPGTTWFDLVSVIDNLAFRDRKQQFTQIQSWAKGNDIASASALIIGDDGNYFDVTGTADILSIATVAVGTVVKLHFDGDVFLRHHASNLILPGNDDIQTSPSDEVEFIEYATGQWRCTNYSLGESSPNTNKILPYSGSVLRDTLSESLFSSVGSDAIEITQVPNALRLSVDLTAATTPVINVPASSSVVLPAGFYHIYNQYTLISLQIRIAGVWRDLDGYSTGATWVASTWSDGTNVRMTNIHSATLSNIRINFVGTRP